VLPTTLHLWLFGGSGIVVGILSPSDGAESHTRAVNRAAEAGNWDN
jgi:hypothetical protein